MFIYLIKESWYLKFFNRNILVSLGFNFWQKDLKAVKTFKIGYPDFGYSHYKLIKLKLNLSKQTTDDGLLVQKSMEIIYSE